MGQLGENEFIDIDPPPTRANQKVLIGRDRLNEIGEPLDKIFRIGGRGLASNNLNKTEDVLGAMAGFTQQQVNPLLMSALMGYILSYGNKEVTPVRLGYQPGGNKIPKALVPI